MEADLTDLPFREYTLRRGQAQKKKKFRRNHSDKRVGTGRLKARIRVYKVRALVGLWLVGLGGWLVWLVWLGGLFGWFGWFG